MKLDYTKTPLEKLVEYERDLRIFSETDIGRLLTQKYRAAAESAQSFVNGSPITDQNKDPKNHAIGQLSIYAPLMREGFGQLEQLRAAIEKKNVHPQGG